MWPTAFVVFVKFAWAASSVLPTEVTATVTLFWAVAMPSPSARPSRLVRTRPLRLRALLPFLWLFMSGCLLVNSGGFRVCGTRSHPFMGAGAREPSAAHLPDPAQP